MEYVKRIISNFSARAYDKLRQAFVKIHFLPPLF